MGAQLFLLRALSLVLVALAQVGETSRPSAVRLGRGRAVGARASALAMPKRQPPSARRSRDAGAAKRCRSYEHEVEDAAEVTGRTPWRRPRLGSWGGSEHKDVLECTSFCSDPCPPPECAKVEKEETVAGAKNPARNGTPADTIPDEAMVSEMVCVVTPDGKSYSVRVRRQEVPSGPSTPPPAPALVPQLQESRTQNAVQSCSEGRVAGRARGDGGLAALVDSIEREMQGVLQARRCALPKVRSMAPPPLPPAQDDSRTARGRREVSGKRQRVDVLRGGGASGVDGCESESGARRSQRGREPRSRRLKGLTGEATRRERQDGVLLAGDRGGGGKTRGKRACLGHEPGSGGEHIVTVPERAGEELGVGERAWEASGEEEVQHHLAGGSELLEPGRLAAALPDAPSECGTWPDARGTLAWSSEARGSGGLGDAALGGLDDGEVSAGSSAESSEVSSAEVLGGEEEDVAEMAGGAGALAGALSSWRPNGCGASGRGGLPWLL
jgi:hypothetical protein